MNGTCVKCGAAIKNIVAIGGKTYGTSCAETVLGVRLPKDFAGDGAKFKAEKQLSDADNIERFRQTIEITAKGWNVNEEMTATYRKAQSEWERDFVRSCAAQITATLLLELGNDTAFDAAKREWKDYMGSFPYRKYDLNDTLKSLSEKQLSILNKIATK